MSRFSLNKISNGKNIDKSPEFIFKTIANCIIVFLPKSRLKKNHHYQFFRFILKKFKIEKKREMLLKSHFFWKTNYTKNTQLNRFYYRIEGSLFQNNLSKPKKLNENIDSIKIKWATLENLIFQNLFGTIPKLGLEILEKFSRLSKGDIWKLCFILKFLGLLKRNMGKNLIWKIDLGLQWLVYDLLNRNFYFSGWFIDSLNWEVSRLKTGKNFLGQGWDNLLYYSPNRKTKLGLGNFLVKISSASFFRLKLKLSSLLNKTKKNKICIICPFFQLICLKYFLLRGISEKIFVNLLRIFNYFQSFLIRFFMNFTFSTSSRNIFGFYNNKNNPLVTFIGKNCIFHSYKRNLARTRIRIKKLIISIKNIMKKFNWVKLSFFNYLLFLKKNLRKHLNLSQIYKNSTNRRNWLRIFNRINTNENFFKGKLQNISKMDIFRIKLNRNNKILILVSCRIFQSLQFKFNWFLILNLIGPCKYPLKFLKASENNYSKKSLLVDILKKKKVPLEKQRLMSEIFVFNCKKIL